MCWKHYVQKVNVCCLFQALLRSQPTQMLHLNQMKSALWLFSPMVLVLSGTHAHMHALCHSASILKLGFVENVWTIETLPVVDSLFNDLSLNKLLHFSNSRNRILRSQILTLSAALRNLSLNIISHNGPGDVWITAGKEIKLKLSYKKIKISEIFYVHAKGKSVKLYMFSAEYLLHLHKTHLD